MAQPSGRGPDHWDSVCIGFVTLATAILVGLFTLIGLGDEALVAGRFRYQVMVTGGLAIAAYFISLFYAYGAIFTEPVEQKKSSTQEVAGIFIAEAMAVAATAVFVVWAKLELTMPQTPAAE